MSRLTVFFSFSSKQPECNESLASATNDNESGAGTAGFHLERVDKKVARGAS